MEPLTRRVVMAASSISASGYMLVFSATGGEAQTNLLGEFHLLGCRRPACE